MTKDEFKIWYAHHATAFMGLEKWLASQPPLNHESAKVALIRRWFDVLQDLTLDDAKNATDILSGSPAEIPKSYGQHAEAVRRIWKRIGPSSPESVRRDEWEPVLRDGVWQYKCPVCECTGFVTVFDPKVVELVREHGLMPNGRPKSLRYNTFSCPCSCEHPQAIQGRTKSGYGYDPNKFIRVQLLYHPERRDAKGNPVVIGDKWAYLQAFLDGDEIVSVTVEPALPALPSPGYTEFDAWR